MKLADFIAAYQKVPVDEFPNHVVESLPSPLVSCRVSTYQHAPYIRQCLDGILMQQTDFPFEIVVGEDESNDGTREICVEYAQSHPDRIRLFLHKRQNNITIDGKPSAKFQGTYTMFHCRGRYHAMCEGDDYWTDPLKLQKQVDLMEKDASCTLCFHLAVKTDGQTEVTYPVGIEGPEYRLDDLFEANVIPTCSVMYRNVLKGELPEWYFQMPIGDWPLHILHAVRGRVRIINECMSVHRIQPGGVWSGINGVSRFEAILPVYQSFLKHFPETAPKDRILELIADMRIQIVRYCLVWGVAPGRGRKPLLRLLLQGRSPVSSLSEFCRLLFWVMPMSIHASRLLQRLRSNLRRARNAFGNACDS